MKLFVITVLFGACYAAELANTYLPPTGASSSGGNSNILTAPGFQQSSPSFQRFGQTSLKSTTPGFQFDPSQSTRPTRPIAILKQSSNNDGYGNYQFEYETENKIAQQERGQLKNRGTEQEANEVEGFFTYEAPNGQIISLTYTANENGFQPSGSHIPTPPPIPEAIALSIQRNAEAAATAATRSGYPSSTTGAYYQNRIPSREYLAPTITSRPSQQGGYRY